MKENTSCKALRIAGAVMSVLAVIVSAAAIYLSAGSGIWLFAMVCIPVLLFPVLYITARKKSGSAIKSRAGWIVLLVVSLLLAALFGLLTVMSLGSDAAIFSALLLTFIYCAADAAAVCAILSSGKKNA